MPPYLAAFLVEATTRPANTTAARYAERMPRVPSPHLSLPPPSPPSRCTRPSPGLHLEQQVLAARCLRPAPKASQPSGVNDVRLLVVETAPRRCNHLTRAPLARQATRRNPESLNPARVTASNASASPVSERAELTVSLCETVLGHAATRWIPPRGAAAVVVSRRRLVRVNGSSRADLPS